MAKSTKKSTGPRAVSKSNTYTANPFPSTGIRPPGKHKKLIIILAIIGLLIIGLFVRQTILITTSKHDMDMVIRQVEGLKFTSSVQSTIASQSSKKECYIPNNGPYRKGNTYCGEVVTYTMKDLPKTNLLDIYKDADGQIKSYFDKLGYKDDSISFFSISLTTVDNTISGSADLRNKTKTCKAEYDAQRESKPVITLDCYAQTHKAYFPLLDD